MIRKSTLRACIVTILIVSSIGISGVGFTAAQSGGFQIQTGYTIVDATYMPQSDMVVVLENNGGLYAYDRATENLLWSKSTVYDNPSEIEYSSATNWFYVVGATNDDEIRAYDSDGDYQGGYNGVVYSFGVDYDRGNVIGFPRLTNGGDTVTSAIMGASNFTVISNGPTTQDEYVEDINEDTKVSITSDSTQNTYVYTYNNWTQITYLPNSNPSETLYRSLDWWDLNDNVVLTANGMYDIHTGDQYFGWGTSHAIDVHPDQNTAYRMINGRVYSYSQSGQNIGSTAIAGTSNGPVSQQTLTTIPVNNEDKLLYTNTIWGAASGYVGIIDAPTTPQIDGYVHKKNGGKLPNANVTISQSGSELTTVQTNGRGYYSVFQPTGTYNMTANKKGWAPDSATVTLNNDVRQNFTLLNKSGIFDFQVNNWMDHGSTQQYHAYFNAGMYRESVRENTIVTSANTSVITVDESNYSLEATSNTNVSRQVPITAAYLRDGVWYNETRNVTVSPRTIEHIGVLPPEQWPAAALGFGEDGTVFGMGSEIQWILLAIFAGAAAAWFARNEWMGVGVILGCIILFWALGNVSLGIMLIALFYGLFVAYQLNKIPSRSDTDVGGNLGEQSQEMNRPSDQYK